jgi:hypothetical protein
MGLKLSGGAGADRFVFGPSQGLDVQISDFRGHAPGGDGDVIVLKGFADHTIAEAVANGHISQSGADVVVSDGSGPVITLQNTLLSQLGRATSCSARG